jgi:hypothetical protein
MNPTELSRAIAKEIPFVLPKDANTEIREYKRSKYLSCRTKCGVSTKRKVLVWLFVRKEYVTVGKRTETEKGNITSEGIMRVTSERDIPRALEKIKELYLERNS